MMQPSHWRMTPTASAISSRLFASSRAVLVPASLSSPIAPHVRLLSRPRSSIAFSKLLAILVPIEHHRPPPWQRLRELSESPKRIPAIVNSANHSS